MGDIIYHIFAIILLVAIGKEVYEDLYEGRRTKAIIGCIAAAVVVVLDILFGFGLIWRIFA